MDAADVRQLVSVELGKKYVPILNRSLFSIASDSGIHQNLDARLCLYEPCQRRNIELRFTESEDHRLLEMGKIHPMFESQILGVVLARYRPFRQMKIEFRLPNTIAPFGCDVTESKRIRESKHKHTIGALCLGAKSGSAVDTNKNSNDISNLTLEVFLPESAIRKTDKQIEMHRITNAFERRAVFRLVNATAYEGGDYVAEFLDSKGCVVNAKSMIWNRRDQVFECMTNNKAKYCSIKIHTANLADWFNGVVHHAISPHCIELGSTMANSGKGSADGFMAFNLANLRRHPDIRRHSQSGMYLVVNENRKEQLEAIEH